MCAKEILKTKQNLSPLPKRSKDMALQVPFLATGLYSLMAIACVFDELKFEDFYYNQATFLVGTTCEHVHCFISRISPVHFLKTAVDRGRQNSHMCK